MEAHPLVTQILAQPLKTFKIIMIDMFKKIKEKWTK